MILKRVSRSKSTTQPYHCGCFAGNDKDAKETRNSGATTWLDFYSCILIDHVHCPELILLPPSCCCSSGGNSLKKNFQILNLLSTSNVIRLSRCHSTQCSLEVVIPNRWFGNRRRVHRQRPWGVGYITINRWLYSDPSLLKWWLHWSRGTGWEDKTLKNSHNMTGL